MHRSRLNYWSLRSFAKKLREKAGLANPSALTFEDWEAHKEACKNKAPITYWITTKGFNIAQNIVMFIPDVYYTIRYATIWTYIKNVKMFHKALWRHRSYDYSGLLQFMIIASKDMQKGHENDNLHKDNEKRAKDLKVFAALLERIAEDDYTKDKVVYIPGKGLGGFKQIPNTLPNYEAAKSFYYLTGKQRHNDLKLAGKLFSTKLLSWWC